MWRRARPGEADPEMLWFGVSVAALAVAWLWVRLGLPSPACPFHEWTGWPCPGCGATRCVHLAFRGSPGLAFVANPLVFAALAGTALFDLYVAMVLALRLPRWRWERLPAWLPASLRAGVAGMLALNWLWLLRSGS